MTTFRGMNPDQVRTTAETVKNRSDALQSLMSQLDSQVRSVPWVGADADEFQARWGVARRSLNDQLLMQLHRAEIVLEDNADDQDRTSSDRDARSDRDASGGASGAGVAVPAEASAGMKGWLVGSKIQPLTQVRSVVDTVSGALVETAKWLTDPEGLNLPSGSELLVGGLHEGVTALGDSFTLPLLGPVDLPLGDDGRGYAGEVKPAGSDLPLRAPINAADLISNTGASYSRDGTVTFSVVKDEAGNVTGVVANIPGTQSWNPMAGDNPLDLSGNAAQAGPGGWSAGSEAVAEAIDKLYTQHGIDPSTPLLLSGHSQGGMIATSLAANSDFTSKYAVRDVFTYGSPVGDYDVASGIHQVNIQHRYDVVPRLDGFEALQYQGPNSTTITMPSPGRFYEAVDNHAVGNYAESARNNAEVIAATQHYQDLYFAQQGGSVEQYEASVHRKID